MKLIIKNQFFSFGGGSSVTDEAGNPVFRVNGRWPSPTKKKIICDIKGNKLFTVRNKYWRWWTYRTFVFDAEGNRVATIKKHKYNLSSNWTIEDSVDSLRIEGKFFSPRCQILRNEQVIGTITRKFTIVNDTYELEGDEKDIPFLLALCVAFDNITDDRKGQNR